MANYILFPAALAKAKRASSTTVTFFDKPSSHSQLF
jgi:hypothetical protein